MPHDDRRRTATTWALWALVVVAVLAYSLDQWTKNLVVASMNEGQTIPVIGEILQLHFVRNPGAAFSLATGSTWIFSILAAVVTVVIIVLARRIRSLPWGIVFGLLLGGVAGNLTDRLVREPSFGLGHVVDFISTPWLVPAYYNIADSCIVVAMIVFVLLTLFGVNLDGTRTRKRGEEEAEHTAGADGQGEPEGTTP